MDEPKMFEVVEDGCVTTWVAATSVRHVIASSGVLDDCDCDEVTITRLRDWTAIADKPIQNDGGPPITMREAFRQACVEMQRTNSTAAIVASTEW
jgi:hypothetical protein